MKRVVIVCVLFVITLSLSIFCTWQAIHTCDNMKQRVVEVYDAIKSGDEEAIAKQVGEMHSYWVEKEYILSPFVRHSLLDETSRAIVQTLALVHESGRVELCAQLEIIIWQMEHLWESEFPNWHNIL